ncbi:MAG: LytTR family transcriptional regulator DNA-binding domain-containing protein [Erysipelotrichaceae bacterium]|nr:LytTR family transcriptional regulator DNA-binding domain-containing protein [Erysipelotrichaceae bacterium]
MFKIKFPAREKEIIMQTLGITEEEPYQIVLCDSPEDVEADKINITFSMEHLDLVKEKIQFFAMASPVYLVGETYRGQVRVQTKDINYIESYGNDVTAYTNLSKVELPNKLYELVEQLEPFGFFRINKSQIVNVAKIVAVRSAFNGKLTVTLENDTSLEVNRSYKAAFKKYLEER